jgi:HAD superfamily hydrolase (TIGR01509 family)
MAEPPGTGGTRRLPAAALFDWDGTIADTLPLIYRANLAALRELGISMDRKWFRDRYTPDWRSSYRELGVPEDRWAELGSRWAEEMSRGRPRALPWARAALRRLRRHGVRLGLVTASTRAVVEPSIARLGLAGVFETEWYSDDVDRTKPSPEALLRAVAEMGLDPADTVYVGDTTVDLEMAAAAGAPFIAVGTTTSEAAFHAAGVLRVWSSVGAWADHLLEGTRPIDGGPPRLANRSGRQGPRDARPR